MPTQTAAAFRTELNQLKQALREVSPAWADIPFREGGWTRKQIIGHLLDSAANNRLRFARASIDGSYTGPFYQQDAWVLAHGYAEQDWQTLLTWWEVEHAILANLVDRIPEDRLDAICNVGDDPPVTLRFLIEDYIAHQQGHLRQIQSASVPS